ncbi:endonuclease/exonuclease/phosphatase family protein [Hyphobacterium sp.]|jgi:endonuclease/exonuclease/phosphatase family metal-dependent hydrolase|uniref:endonuclease/exonuclease/phosphatase family protein n=1 Tax=Hyphobacterium sp. TaxID=2004662 RepID=UPI003BA9774B
MPQYSKLRRVRDSDHRTHVIDRLLELRTALNDQIGSKKKPGSFTLATWNIRDFDSNKFGHGKRRPESFHYIAEILSNFDLTAVQEVNRDISALEKTMDLLGPDYDFIVTDTTEGASGNTERLAYVFNRKTIRFRNVAGEIVLPKHSGVLHGDDELQFARTPFLVAFQAGWFKFSLCTVHIYYGAASGQKLQRRIKEISRLAHFFRKRQDKEREDFILLGDFNIVDQDHQTMKALTDAGFIIPDELRDDPSSFGNKHFYDQIAMRVRDKRAEIGAAGVFDFKPYLYDGRDYDRYFDAMVPDQRDIYPSGNKKDQPRTEADKKKYFMNEWRTFQISDHLPMWVNIRTDFTDDYLNSLKPGADVLT